MGLCGEKVPHLCELIEIIFNKHIQAALIKIFIEKFFIIILRKIRLEYENSKNC